MCSLNKTLTKETNTPSARKEVNPMPSPFGEGQINTPINHHYLGEVQINLSPVSLRYATGCFAIPQGGEAQTSSNKVFPMENHHNHQPTSPLPKLALSLSKGGKRRAELARPGSAGRAGVEAGGGIGLSQTPYSPELIARTFWGHPRIWGYSFVYQRDWTSRR
jgi:hypothetical protein